MEPGGLTPDQLSSGGGCTPPRCGTISYPGLTITPHGGCDRPVGHPGIAVITPHHGVLVFHPGCTPADARPGGFSAGYAAERAAAASCPPSATV
ncbi:MAG: hypothetical protein ACYDA6_00005, partial [Solirubrobacteraceae bacterium]